MKWIHIIAGLLAIASGAVALYAAKGSTLHRKSGMIFVIAMLLMTSTAMVIAALFNPHSVNVVGAILTFYLVGTGVFTVLRTVEQMRGLLTGFMVMALMGSAYAFVLGFEALDGASGRLRGIPPQPLFMFGLIGVGAALGDARLLWVGRIQGAGRLARHLWRMSLAMWITTASAFLGQAKFFPEPIRKSGLLVVPVLLVLGVMIYWLARVLLKRRRTAIVDAKGLRFD